jgi:hypothetical protein
MTPDLAKGTSIEACRAASMEAAWAAPHHAPPHGGSKDQAGLRFPRRTYRCDAVLEVVWLFWTGPIVNL